MERTSNTTAEELTSRRAIRAAVLGAAAATAAAAVLPAEHASAANGDPLILGQANTANDATDLDGQLVVHSSAGSNENPSDVAVQGTSLYGTGVLGHTRRSGVRPARAFAASPTIPVALLSPPSGTSPDTGSLCAGRSGCKAEAAAPTSLRADRMGCRPSL